MLPIELRLNLALDKSGDHWLFTGMKNPGGYGLMWDNRRRNNSAAHRIAYEFWVGSIPTGCQVHHICQVRACCRPDHLVLMYPSDHSRHHHPRATHCVNGHAYTAENTRWGRGQQVCIACSQASSRKYHANNREVVNARKRAKRKALGHEGGSGS